MKDILEYISENPYGAGIETRLMVHGLPRGLSDRSSRGIRIQLYGICMYVERNLTGEQKKLFSAGYREGRVYTAISQN